MTTSLVVTTDPSLVKTVAPALPFAPMEYQKSYHDQVNNILRLYFNQIDKLISQLSLRGAYTVADLPDPIVSGAGARAAALVLRSRPASSGEVEESAAAAGATTTAALAQQG